MLLLSENEEPILSYRYLMHAKRIRERWYDGSRNIIFLTFLLISMFLYFS